MSFVLQPWQVFFVTLAAWVNREQQATIEFYQVELEAMMAAQGKKRLLLTDEQRRRLSVKGKALGRKALMELTTIVTRSCAGTERSWTGNGTTRIAARRTAGLGCGKRLLS